MAERKATVQIVDGGGRAAALAAAYARSPDVERIIVAPGNDLIKYVCHGKPVETFPSIKTTDVEAQLKLAQEKGVTFVDVAQENAIERGLVDRFKLSEIPVLGATRKAGRTEWDKGFARILMEQSGIPIPRYLIFGDGLVDEKLASGTIAEILKDHPVFLKAAGLAEGKGAFPIRDKSDITEAMARLKGLKTDGGRGFLVEEWVQGEEFSAYFLGYGGAFKEIGYAQDHKRLNNNDEGLNTGGMGAIAPARLIEGLPRLRIREEIVNPFARSLAKSRTYFNGVLYVGGMYNKATDQLWVIEFNDRWGDPEAEVIVPGIEADFYHLSRAAAEATRSRVDCFDHIPDAYDGMVRVDIVGTSLGYPDDYTAVKGRKIVGLDTVMKRERVIVYGAGVTEQDGNFYANGGRLFHLVARGYNVEDARALALAEMSRIYIPGDRPGENLLHYRTDIGLKEVQRLYHG